MVMSASNKLLHVFASFLLILSTSLSLGCSSPKPEDGATDIEQSTEAEEQEGEVVSDVNEPTEQTFDDVETIWSVAQGYYTAGVDIPAGTFDITGVAGIGFVSAPSNAANMCGPSYDDEDYTETYRNFSLEEGDIFWVTGVQVQLDYSKITSDVTGRTYDESAALELGPGNYVVGTDIPAGRYNVRYISGDGGFISSDRYDGDCIASGNMDGDPDTGDYTDLISNVVLEDGETIEVTSGLTVSFIPEA